jgi:hypothetical protein
VLPYVEAVADACRVEPVILLRVVKVFYPAEGMGFTFGPAEIRRTEVPCGRAARNLQCKEFLFLLSIFADPAARLRGLHSLGIFKCEVGRREVQLVSLKRWLEGLKKWETIGKVLFKFAGPMDPWRKVCARRAFCWHLVLEIQKIPGRPRRRYAREMK